VIVVICFFFVFVSIWKKRRERFPIRKIPQLLNRNQNKNYEINKCNHRFW
jgi:hypothetical protein